MNTEKPPLERITMQRIFAFFLDIFNIEKGLWYTLRELSLRPGSAIKVYLFENRDKLVKPFRYLILSTTILAFITINYIGFDDTSFLQGVEAGYMEAAKEDGHGTEAAPKMKQFIKTLENSFNKYYGSFIIFSVPFYALAFMWLLKKPRLNYAEHLVLTSYLIAHQSVLGILTTPLVKHVEAGIIVQMILTTAYLFYLLIQFFDYKFTAAFFRSVIAYLIGTFIYMLLFISALLIILLLQAN